MRHHRPTDCVAGLRPLLVSDKRQLQHGAVEWLRLLRMDTVLRTQHIVRAEYLGSHTSERKKTTGQFQSTLQTVYREAASNHNLWILYVREDKKKKKNEIDQETMIALIVHVVASIA